MGEEGTNLLFTVTLIYHRVGTQCQKKGWILLLLRYVHVVRRWCYVRAESSIA